MLHDFRTESFSSRESISIYSRLGSSRSWILHLPTRSESQLSSQEAKWVQLSTWCILQESTGFILFKVYLNPINPIFLYNFWDLLGFPPGNFHRIEPTSPQKGCSLAPRIYVEQRRPKRPWRPNPSGVRQKKRHTEPWPRKSASLPLKGIYGCFPQNGWWKEWKKPYEKMDDLGVLLIFRNIHISSVSVGILELKTYFGVRRDAVPWGLAFFL